MAIIENNSQSHWRSRGNYFKYLKECSWFICWSGCFYVTNRMGIIISHSVKIICVTVTSPVLFTGFRSSLQVCSDTFFTSSWGFADARDLLPNKLLCEAFGPVFLSLITRKSWVHDDVSCLYSSFLYLRFMTAWFSSRVCLSAVA